MNKIKIEVINTGGTFSKEYNKKTGLLEVNCNELNSYIPVKHNTLLIEDLIFKLNISPSIEIAYTNIICKDSLDMTDKDRQKLVDLIKQMKTERILVVHGTDTIDKTAEFLDKNIHNKKIVLTGAMYPYRINPIEAGSNFASALTTLQLVKNNGIYIAIDGIVSEYKNIKKNKDKAYFFLKDTSAN